MISRVDSLGLNGISGYPVCVECFITNGLPAFEIVGLPDAAVKEARERVRAAVKNSGFKFPVSRITLNLAPANTRKSGTLYDLPILLGILSATELCRLPKEPSAFLGELSLEGKLRPVNGVLPMAIAARQAGFRALYDPSHFVWQMMDYISPIYEFKDRIFHVHFKDIKLYPERLKQTGILAYPLQYMQPKLPGLGDVDWGRYVSALTDIGYDGYACIEVEDRAFEGSREKVENSLVLSKRYLDQFVI